MLTSDERLGLALIVFVFITFPIACAWFCWWVDKEKNYVSRLCRRKEYHYHKSERKRK